MRRTKRRIEKILGWEGESKLSRVFSVSSTAAYVTFVLSALTGFARLWADAVLACIAGTAVFFAGLSVMLW